MATDVMTSINGTVMTMNDVAANIEAALRSIEANHMPTFSTFEDIASLCASFVMSDFNTLKLPPSSEETT